MFNILEGKTLVTVGDSITYGADMDPAGIAPDGTLMTYGWQIAERNGREVTIRNARRLWYWDGAASLSQLAAEGTSKPSNCKFTVTVSSITILDAIEILPCTVKAKESIEGVAVWRA